jgi:hypothetical protein
VHRAGHGAIGSEKRKLHSVSVSVDWIEVRHSPRAVSVCSSVPFRPSSWAAISRPFRRRRDMSVRTIEASVAVESPLNRAVDRVERPIFRRLGRVGEILREGIVTMIRFFP